MTSLATHSDTETPGPRPDEAGSAPSTITATNRQPSQVEIAAARLKITVDQRLGRATPQWVHRVAEGLTPYAA